MVDDTVFECVCARAVGWGRCARGDAMVEEWDARAALEDAFQTRADGGARDVIERAREREACGRV